jgi:hypothetical protein
VELGVLLAVHQRVAAETGLSAEAYGLQLPQIGDKPYVANGNDCLVSSCTVCGVCCNENILNGIDCESCVQEQCQTSLPESFCGLHAQNIAAGDDDDDDKIDSEVVRSGALLAQRRKQLASCKEHEMRSACQQDQQCEWISSDQKGEEPAVADDAGRFEVHSIVRAPTPVTKYKHGNGDWEEEINGKTQAKVFFNKKTHQYSWSDAPTPVPTTAAPTYAPNQMHRHNQGAMFDKHGGLIPTSIPTASPTNPTAVPTTAPTSIPSLATISPTLAPTATPTPPPTNTPTAAPTLTPSSTPSSSPSSAPTFSAEWFKRREKLILKDNQEVGRRGTEVQKIEKDIVRVEATVQAKKQQLRQALNAESRKALYDFKMLSTVHESQAGGQKVVADLESKLAALKAQLKNSLSELQLAKLSEADELRRSTKVPTALPTLSPTMGTRSPTIAPSLPVPTFTPTIALWDKGHYRSAVLEEVHRLRQRLPAFLLKGLPKESEDRTGHLRTPDEVQDQQKMNAEISPRESSYLKILRSIHAEKKELKRGFNATTVSTAEPATWAPDNYSPQPKSSSTFGQNIPTFGPTSVKFGVLYQKNLADRKHFLKYFTPLWYGNPTHAPTLPAATSAAEKLVEQSAAAVAHVLAIAKAKEQAVDAQKLEIANMMSSLASSSDSWGNSESPTAVPTFLPTKHPTPPTRAPTRGPTSIPTSLPTIMPTTVPTPSPTRLCPIGFEKLMTNEADAGSVVVTYGMTNHITNRRCCSLDRTANDFLDIFSDGNLGGIATFTACKHACTTDKDCNFFEIEHTTLTKVTAKSWCSGFAKCDFVCRAPELRHSQSIIKIGKARELQIVSTAIASYPADEPKRCCSWPGAAGEQEAHKWCDLFDDGARGGSTTYVQCKEACAADVTCIFFQIAQSTVTNTAAKSWCRGFTSCDYFCDAPELEGDQTIFRHATCREHLEPPVFLTRAPTARPTQNVWSIYGVLPTPAPTGQYLHVYGITAGGPNGESPTWGSSGAQIDLSSFYTTGPTTQPTLMPTNYPTTAPPSLPPTPKPTPSRFQIWEQELVKNRGKAIAKAEKFTRMISKDPNLQVCPIPGRTYCNSVKTVATDGAAEHSCPGKEHCIFLHEDHVSRWGCCG